MKAKESAGLAIIFEGKVLLAHTTGRGWWGSYGIPKGGIDEGESKLDAAIRETYEEVGIKVPMHMIDKTEHTYTLTGKGQRVNKTVYWYIVKIESLSDLKIKDLKIPKKDLQVEEVDWAGFIPYPEAMKRVMKSQINVINNLRGSGLIESYNSLGDKYNKSEQTMKHVKLFEEFILDEETRVILGVLKESANAADQSIAEAYKLGAKWSKDFDYDGMLAAGTKTKVSMGVKKLQKLLNSFTDVNYHREGQFLGLAIEELEDGDTEAAEDYIEEFIKVCKKTLG